MRQKVSSRKIAHKFLSLCHSAESRGLDFDLSLASVKNLLSAKKCYFTGKELYHTNFSVDRIDNTKGYVKGNVVACDMGFNKAKDNLTVKQIELMYKGLVKKNLIQTKKRTKANE